MYTIRTFHSEGLRWIGSLFIGAADFVDRNDALLRVKAPEALPPAVLADHSVDDVRFRMHVRGLL
jgi:hypothetical protein